MTVREAGAGDFAAIRVLAEAAWWEAYPAIIPAAQIAVMLQDMYTEEALAAQVAAGHRFLVVDGLAAMLSYGIELPYLGGAGIPKLYVHPAHRRRGLATGLMATACARLRDAGAAAVRLRVNRRNVAAINFYFSAGFRIERWTDDWYAEERFGRRFLLDDYVMIKELGSDSALGRAPSDGIGE